MSNRLIHLLYIDKKTSGEKMKLTKKTLLIAICGLALSVTQNVTTAFAVDDELSPYKWGHWGKMTQPAAGPVAIVAPVVSASTPPTPIPIPPDPPDPDPDPLPTPDIPVTPPIDQPTGGGLTPPPMFDGPSPGLY